MLSKETREREVLEEARATQATTHGESIKSTRFSKYTATQLDPRNVGKMSVMLNQDSVFSALENANQRTSINALNT